MNTANSKTVAVKFYGNGRAILVNYDENVIVYALTESAINLEKIFEHKLGNLLSFDYFFPTKMLAFVRSNAGAAAATAAATIASELQLCDIRNKKLKGTVDLKHTITNVKLNQTVLAVSILDFIYIYYLDYLECPYVVKQTARNPAGLLAMPFEGYRCVIAYPSILSEGDLVLFNLTGGSFKHTTIQAHRSKLAIIAFNPTGTKLATASERGTVIRVFCTEDEEAVLLQELRRGLTRCAQIYSLAFSAFSDFLVCSSNTETVHVFQLSASTVQNNGWSSYFKKTIANYLPNELTMERAFACVNLKQVDRKHECAIIQDTANGNFRLLLASTSGHLCVYSIPEDKYGQCEFIQKHELYCSGDSEDSDIEIVSKKT